jgi:tRNA uridine 5-carboxymethylaminomethyl modification enzyme
LVHHAENHGLLSPSRIHRIKEKAVRIDKWVRELESTRFGGDTWATLFRRAGKGIAFPEEFLNEAAPVRDEVMYRIFYQGYLERETRQIERLQDIEKVRIPREFDYMNTSGLRRESAVKLSSIRPLTLGQASRMSGVNPTDISLLMVAIEAGRGGDRTS